MGRNSLKEHLEDIWNTQKIAWPCHIAGWEFIAFASQIRKRKKMFNNMFITLRGKLLGKRHYFWSKR